MPKWLPGDGVQHLALACEAKTFALSISCAK